MVTGNKHRHNKYLDDDDDTTSKEFLAKKNLILSDVAMDLLRF